MDAIYSSHSWSQIIARLGKRGPLRAAIAYVGSGGIVVPQRGDLLICDASRQAIGSGETDAGTLRTWLKTGATIRSLPGLHAKCAVVGDNAIVGSANWSASSEQKLIESVIMTDHIKIVSGISALIARLEDESTLLDAAAIEALLKIPVKRRPIWGKAVRKRDPIETKILMTWTHATQQEIPEEVKAKAKQEVREVLGKTIALEEIIFSKSDVEKRNLKAGDLLITVSHMDKRSIKVYPPVPILSIKCRKKKAYVFIEDKEMPPMSWKNFRHELQKYGRSISKKPDRFLNGCLANIVTDILRGARREKS